MRKLLIVVGLSVTAVGCGSNNTGDPVSACNSFSSAACNRLYACDTDHQLTGTADTCTTAAEAAAGCPTAACDPGKTFNSSNASSCVSAIQNESCTDVQNGTVPAVCNTVCT
jgi:hypothetical protein